MSSYLGIDCDHKTGHELKSTGQATWRRRNTVVHYCHIVGEECPLVDLVFEFLGWF